MIELPRSAWATSSPAWTPMVGAQPTVFVHHVGGSCPLSPTVNWLREFEREAITAGLARGDHYIAVEYHVGVFQDGSIVEFRPDGVQGGATLGHNNNSYAIVAMQNYETVTPTPQLIASIRQRIAQWKADGRVRADAEILPHRAVFNTACPGRNLMAVMDELRQPVQPNQGDDDMTPEQATQMLQLLTQIRDNTLNSLRLIQDFSMQPNGWATINAHLQNIEKNTGK